MIKRKLAVLGAAFALAFSVAACATDTESAKVGPNTWIVCDTGEEDGDPCDGPNPEKGLDSEACLAEGRSIAKIENTSNNAVLVTCGDPLPRSK